MKKLKCRYCHGEVVKGGVCIRHAIAISRGLYTAKYQSVLIRWMDHCSCDEWCNVNAYEGKGVQIFTMGYLVKETPTAYVVVNSMGINRDSSLAMTVLKPCVEQIEYFPDILYMFNNELRCKKCTEFLTNKNWNPTSVITGHNICDSCLKIERGGHQ